MDHRHQPAHYCKTLGKGIAAALLLSASFNANAEVELTAEGITVYGQSELPKVLYIVPWKRKVASEIELPHTESLMTDVLTPIDPEIFERQIRYHELLIQGIE